MDFTAGSLLSGFHLQRTPLESERQHRVPHDSVFFAVGSLMDERAFSACPDGQRCGGSVDGALVVHWVTSGTRVGAGCYGTICQVGGYKGGDEILRNPHWMAAGQ